MKQMLVKIRKRPVTVILLIMNAAVYLYTVRNLNYYVYYGGLNYERVLAHGEWYRFFSCMFLHGGWEHILMNLLSLAFCGFSLEEKIGSVKTLLVYFIAGLSGGILSVLIHAILNQPVYSVGASGAIYGLLSAYAVVKACEEGTAVWKNFGIVVIYAVGTYSVGIDFLGHIGGLLGGAAFSIWLMRR